MGGVARRPEKTNPSKEYWKKPLQKIKGSKWGFQRTPSEPPGWPPASPGVGKCACCWRGKHTRLVSKKCSAADPGLRKCACCWWDNAASKSTRTVSSPTGKSKIGRYTWLLAAEFPDWEIENWTLWTKKVNLEKRRTCIDRPVQQQKTQFEDHWFSLHLKDIMLPNGRKTNSLSHRTRSTWLNNNYL